MSNNVEGIISSPIINTARGFSLDSSVNKNDTRVEEASSTPVEAVAKEVSRADLASSASDVQAIVNSVSDTSLSFSVEKELSRMIVAVRAIGSDEIIKQFPPEEFISVAKFIAEQSAEMIDEDFLKGILFDQYS